MQITNRRYADALVVAPAGRVDHVTAPGLETALTRLLGGAGDGGALVLDFSAIEYVSSGGLRVLMLAANQIRALQGKLVTVAAPGSVVAEIFAISRFDRVLTIVATLEDALGQCSAAALAAYRQSGGKP